MILVPELATIEKTATSRAEVSLARLLAAIEAPPEAVAFHSVRTRSHPYKQQSEIDFVILWKRTIIVVEVKGGGVRKHEGRWYSVDRNTDWHPLSSPPMEQAQSAMHALAKILRDEGVGWFSHEAIVVTPDIAQPPHSVEWKSSHWIAEQGMTVAALTSTLDSIVSGAREAPPRQRVAGVGELRNWLFGEFTRIPVLDAARGAVLEEQARATEGQARVVAGGALNERMLILGGAGTGKSLALANLARQEAASGRSVLVTFGSASLRPFFAALLDGHKVDISPLGDILPGSDYEVLLVDEAQDLMNPMAMDLLSSVLKEGISGGYWRMFLDPNNQSHVDGQFDQDVFDLVRSDSAIFRLGLNVRNTKAIVHVVQQYLQADIGDPAIVHGSRVEWHEATAGGAQAQAWAVAKELEQQGVQASDIWIVVVQGDVAARADHDRFRAVTPQQVKGLEVDHVVACALPSELNDQALAAFYVAVTRARVGLHVVTEPEEKKWLQNMVRREGV